MLYKKIIPLSLVLITTLYAQEIELEEVSVESTLITEVAQNAQISADLAQSLSISVPSVDMNRRSAIANDVYIRGQKRDNISIEVDGTKIYGACPNRMDPPVSHILANQIDEVEVIEGPYDIETFGTMSGGLKIRTKQPTKDVKAEFNFGLGSWGYKKIGAGGSGGNDFVRFLISASYENAGQYEDGDGNTIADQIDNYASVNPAAAGTKFKSNYHEKDAYTKKSVMLKMFVSTAKNQELRLSYTGNRSDDILYGNSKMDAVYDDSNVYSISYNIDNISDIYKNINLQYYASDVDHPMATKYRMSSNMPKMDNTNQLTTEMQGLKLKTTLDLDGYKLLLGLDGSQRKWEGVYYNSTTSLPLAAADSVSIHETTTDNRAVFAKVDKKFGNFDLTIGARYDSTDIDSIKYGSTDYGAFSSNIFASYHIDEENRVFFGIGQSSRVPDARELYFTGSKGNLSGTPNLDQTTNTQIDLGYELTSEMFSLKVKTFYSDLSDFIYIKKGVMVNAFENIDASIYGAEFSATYYATDDMTLDASMSYKRGKKDHALATQTDKDLADIAPLRANLALNYEYANNSIATLEFQASDRWDTIDADNGEQELSGWAIVNMKVKHKLNKNVDITLGVNNLLNKTYAINNTYVDLILITTGSSDVMLMNEIGRYLYTNLNFKF